jgi:hypothetical protein
MDNGALPVEKGYALLDREQGLGMSDAMRVQCGDSIGSGLYF